MLQPPLPPPLVAAAPDALLLGSHGELAHLRLTSSVAGGPTGRLSTLLAGHGRCHILAGAANASGVGRHRQSLQR